MKPLAPVAICARCPRPATKTCSWLEKAVFKKCDAARESLRGMDENPLSAQQMEFLKLFSKVVGPKTIQEGYRDHLL